MTGTRPQDPVDLRGRRLEHRARRRRIVLAVLGAVAGVLAAAAWVVFGSPWLRVARTEVVGVHWSDRAAVHRAVAGEVGRPLALVSGVALHRELARDRYVRAVHVTRDWPGTLRVRVTERVPVAAVPDASGGRFTLIDADAVSLAQVGEVPARVARVSPAVAGGGPAAVGRALSVISALPTEIRQRVTEVVAAGPDDVELQLADGARVLWGGADRDEFKARVLRSLLQQQAQQVRTYDVSTPEDPVLG